MGLIVVNLTGGDAGVWGRAVVESRSIAMVRPEFSTLPEGRAVLVVWGVAYVVEESVAEIAAMAGKGWTWAEVAERFGVALVKEVSDDDRRAGGVDGNDGGGGGGVSDCGVGLHRRGAGPDGFDRSGWGKGVPAGDS